ncbi:bifunctional diguanylate cyclase/phosphodiesterase [Actinoplanes sp. NPDC049596]|uniref:putative bifunctional diguanylate cyclase/phosphodiesterase n=1 Tax=unclassified Actinoplanes TaxID=2626549 RepID=UPI00341F8D73
MRGGTWFTPVAVAAALAETLLIAAGTHVTFPWLLVWAPAVVALTLAVESFRRAAAGRDGTLRTFWRRLAVAMGFVLAAALSQIADLSTTWSGMPPVGARTLVLYVVGTLLAISALLRLPSGGRSWRQLTTAVLDVAVVVVTAGIAGAEYRGWFIGKFGLSMSAWWLNITMMAIGVAGVVVVVKIMSARQSPVPRAALWWLAPVGAAGPLSTVLMTLLLPWPHLSGSAAVLPFVGLFGVLAARAFAAESRAPRVARPSALRRGTSVPLVATGLTSVQLAVVYMRAGHLSTVQVAGTTLLLLLVVARQAIALAENATLLDTVAHRAGHDDLTGLHNRRSFTEAVTADHTVVLADLREFRAINDGLGPEAGDALLVAFAVRLTALAGPDAVVARLGGDVFGVLLPTRTDVPDHAPPADDIPDHAPPAADVPGRSPGGSRFVDRLIAATAEPLRAAGHDMIVDVSVGLAEGSYRQAEIALREAAGGRVVRYDASLERELRQRATIAADLRRALTNGEFHLLYQPIVTLPDGELYGVESLVRWTRPTGEVVSPVDFIPVAEDTGLIVELGAWILETACAQAAAWPGLRSVAVNVSARQLLDNALPELVASALARHGVPPKQLTIEITETAVFGGGRALATVKALSALGVSIALDDFGTGHSSLGLLRTCPVDAIKVDKSFVDGLGGTPEQEAIVTALTGIADTMALRTVAEGVETAAQAARLHELGYHHAQGFHFARPLPPSAITELLTSPEPAAA